MHTCTGCPRFTSTCPEAYRGWPDQDPGGWGVTNHIYHLFLQIRSTSTHVVDISPAHAEKSTEDGQTTIQGGGWLAFTFTIHFCRLAAFAHLSSTFR